ncbi:MAG TPA: dihydroorotate dehydrogenase [Planctomycetota bacterium]|nr:dihydroorotate dehydrogenase [Planctomycetota bacterium]
MSGPPSLAISLGPLRLSNPVLVASGTFGGIFDQVFDLDRLGGIVLKTVTVQERKGNPTPRVFETASGMLNSIGLENPGIDRFLAEELPKYGKLKTRIVANVAGKDVDEFGFLAERMSSARIDALELNLSCPNVTGGLDFATRPEVTERVVRLCRSKIKAVPIIAKLTPNVTDVVTIARAAVEGGADIVSLINTIKGIAIDWRRRKPFLGGVTGGLSGPAIKPVALRMVWEVCSALPRVPVMAIGGISNAEDALEFICAGARAVQVGTASFVEPTAAVRIVEELPSLLAAERVESIESLVGSVSPKAGSAPASHS